MPAKTMKEWEKEISKYRRDIEKDPTDSNAYYNLGCALIQANGGKIMGGQLDSQAQAAVKEAETSLKKAIELYSGHGRAHVLLGQLYRYLNRFDDAIKYAKKGKELPPGSKDWFAASETVASCYMNLNKIPEAIEELEAIKQHYPDDSMILFKSGVCYAEVGKLDEAEKDFQHLVEVDPHHPNAKGCLEQVRQRKAVSGATKPSSTKSAPTATEKKVQDTQAKAQVLAQKLQEDIQKVMASDMAPEKKSSAVTKLQKKFSDELNKLMKS